MRAFSTEHARIIAPNGNINKVIATGKSINSYQAMVATTQTIWITG